MARVVPSGANAAAFTPRPTGSVKLAVIFPVPVSHREVLLLPAPEPAARVPSGPNATSPAPLPRGAARAAVIFLSVVYHRALLPFLPTAAMRPAAPTTPPQPILCRG